MLNVLSVTAVTSRAFVHESAAWIEISLAFRKHMCGVYCNKLSGMSTPTHSQEQFVIAQQHPCVYFPVVLQLGLTCFEIVLTFACAAVRKGKRNNVAGHAVAVFIPPSFSGQPNTALYGANWSARV